MAHLFIVLLHHFDVIVVIAGDYNFLQRLVEASADINKWGAAV